MRVCVCMWHMLDFAESCCLNCAVLRITDVAEMATMSLAIKCVAATFLLTSALERSGLVGLQKRPPGERVGVVCPTSLLWFTFS